MKYLAARVALLTLMLTSLTAVSGLCLARAGHNASGVQLTYKLVNAVVSETAVYGSSVFWTQTVPPRHGNAVPERLFFSRISPITRHLLFTFPSGATVLHLAASKDWVIASLSGTDGSSLWVFNRKNHSSRTLHSWSVSSGVIFQGFAFSDDTLVYIIDKLGKSGGAGSFQIHSRTLPNGADHIGYSRTMACGGLSVTGVSSLLWIGTRSYRCGGSDVISIDPTTGDVTPLTTSHNGIEPFTNGTDTGWILAPPAEGGLAGHGKVVLVTPRSTNPRVISRAGKTWPAGCATGAGKHIDSCATQPGITSKLVFWINGAGKPEVYNLQTNRATEINTQNPPSIGGFGQGSGDIIDWPSAVSQPHPGQPQSWIVIARIKSNSDAS